MFIEMHDFDFAQI